MATLLHIDSSINGDKSASRAVTATFASEWKRANPGGTYIYRDLAAESFPHIDAAAYAAARTPEAEHTPEQAARWALSKVVIGELVAADVIVIGAPMYNYSIPSTLKAWIDRIAIPRFRANPATGEGELVGKRVVVVTARGGSYAPGTPRAPFDFQEPYLRAFFNFLGLDKSLTFVHTEFTMAQVNPALAQFKELGAASWENAHKAARDLASR